MHKQDFVQAYESVKDVILRNVDNIIKESKQGSGDELQERDEKSLLSSLQKTAEESLGKLEPEDEWHIYTTGHSMGGALATLCAHELAVSTLIWHCYRV